MPALLKPEGASYYLFLNNVLMNDDVLDTLVNSWMGVVEHLYLKMLSIQGITGDGISKR